MPTLVDSPTRIAGEGNKPKVIEEFVGRVNTETTAVSIARMSSPSGWVEPGQMPDFDEFTVDFNETGRSVSHINRELLKSGIQGGKDLSSEFPDLKNTALYCVTELHTQADIDKLVTALTEIVA